MKLLIIGAPGSGKGTIANYIVNSSDIKHISTGDLFRAKIDSNDELAIKIKELIKNGILVPDEITNEIVKETLTDTKDNFILDGYPRTLDQAKYLETLVDIDRVLYLNVNIDSLIKRIVGRRICEDCNFIFNIYTNPVPKNESLCDKCNGNLYQRKDDNEETVIKRLEIFNEQTSVLIEYYKNKDLLVEIDANRDLEIIFEEINKWI